VTGRDDARAHPSLDELADLREGLLADADSARLRDHVGGCADCAAEVAALAEVSTVLRDAGAEPVAMPDSVAEAIDAALRDAATMPSAQREPRRLEPVESRRLRWLKPAFGWAAGVAAAAVIVGGGVIGLGGAGGGSDDNAGGSSLAADGAADAESTRPTQPKAGDQLRVELRQVDKARLPAFARDLTGLDLSNGAATTSGADGTGGQASESRAVCKAPHGIGGLRQPVRWYGLRALVVVSREARVASVYSCDPTPRLLYSAPY
jgi:hypothetical protein